MRQISGAEVAAACYRTAILDHDRLGMMLRDDGMVLSNPQEGNDLWGYWMGLRQCWGIQEKMSNVLGHAGTGIRWSKGL